MKDYIEQVISYLLIACTLFILYYYRMMSEHAQNEYKTIAIIVNAVFIISIVYLLINYRTRKQKEKGNE